MKEETEYVPGKHLMIGGDFNSRIGEKGGRKTDVHRRRKKEDHRRKKCAMKKAMKC